ncbi:protein UL135 [Panine betaherpesvirus 2]|uniref:Protein UL135 n=1 Tax=Panine betaherpesvirus 2 TaxID=188763 RepID=Q8QRW7_9BETA|nr:protein UL135 [Panine betaherpesvirus 2]AAM00772.1 protein UL135 [Panine betaherpesvirus 2]QXV67885.1 protein UL135 [Panine betaherpesvirus 2]
MLEGSLFLVGFAVLMALTAFALLIVNRRRARKHKSRRRFSSTDAPPGFCGCCQRSDKGKPVPVEIELMDGPRTPQKKKKPPLSRDERDDLCTSVYIGEPKTPKPEFPPSRYEIPDVVVTVPSTPSSLRSAGEGREGEDGREDDDTSSTSSDSSSTSVDTVISRPPSWKPAPPPCPSPSSPSSLGEALEQHRQLLKSRPPTPPVRAPSTHLTVPTVPPTPLPRTVPTNGVETPLVKVTANGHPPAAPGRKKQGPPTKPKPVWPRPALTPQTYVDPRTPTEPTRPGEVETPATLQHKPTPHKPPRTPRLPRTPAVQNLTTMNGCSTLTRGRKASLSSSSCSSTLPRAPGTMCQPVSVKDVAPPPSWTDIDNILDEALRNVLRDAESMQT